MRIAHLFSEVSTPVCVAVHKGISPYIRDHGITLQAFGKNGGVF